MDELDIKELVEILLEKKWFIIFITIICMIIGYVYNAYFEVPVYSSSTTLLLAKTTDQTYPNAINTLESQAITQTDVTLNEKLVSTYSELAKSSGVINQVIKNLGLNISEQEVKSSIKVSEVDNTEILKISVSNHDPSLAAQIVNELADVFTKRIEDLYSISNIKVVDSAIESTIPDNINPKKYAAIGAGIGFIFSVILVLFINIIKNTARSAKQVEKNTKISVLATIGKDKNNAEELTAYVDSKSSITESFKGLRTNIKFYKKEPVKSIAITSAVPEEGKSWVSSNLAIIFAKNGEKVLLIDADMRRGRQNRIFGLRAKPGLSDLLKDKDLDNIEQYIKSTEIENLNILTCGDFTQDSSELLLTDTFEKALEILKAQYDMIIIDTTPNSIVTDGIIISRLVDTNVIVTKYNSTNLDTIDRITENIQKVGGNVLGLIINQIPNMNKKYKDSYYYTAAMVTSKISKFNNSSREGKRYI